MANINVKGSAKDMISSRESQEGVWGGGRAAVQIHSLLTLTI